MDFKNLTFKTVQSSGKNGAVSITSFLNSKLIKIFGHFWYENVSTVDLFQATRSNHLKISKTVGFQQMICREKVDLKYDLLFLVKHKQ